MESNNRVVVVGTRQCIIIVLNGRIDHSAGTAEMLRKILDRLTSLQRALKIVIDLDTANYVDSNSLGIIVSAWVKIKANKGELVLACPNKRVSEMLQITTLDKHILVFEKRTEAKAHLIQSLGASLTVIKSLPAGT